MNNGYLSNEDEKILAVLNLEEPDLKALQEAVFHAEKLLESARAALELAKSEANRKPRAIAILESLRAAGIGEEAIKAALLAQFGRVKSKTGPKPPEEKQISTGLPDDSIRRAILEKIELTEGAGLTIDELYLCFPNIAQISILSVVKNATLDGDVIKVKKIIGRALQDKYVMRQFVGGIR